MTRILAALALAALVAGCRTGDDTPPPPAQDATPAGPAADSTAARDVLSRYYAAIETRDHAAAYALWGREGAASGQSFEEFVAGFARTAYARIEFTGSVTLEGAAGSIFATVPVRVHATTTDGAAQEFAGVYELRRVNDVPGATPEQLRWHIHGARLDVVP